MAIKKFKFNEALIFIWDLISFCDKYINDEKLVGNSKTGGYKRFIFYHKRDCRILLNPFLPETSEKINKALKSKKSEILISQNCKIKFVF